MGEQRTQASAVAALHVAERLGVIARPAADDPREAWGILNPGGCAARDGTYYLFPRLVAEGNYSRIGIARLLCDAHDRPVGIERMGIALEPQQPYEFNSTGGGVEDARVTYVRALDMFVMAYTAYAPLVPRVALAASPDLLHWRRLGPVHFAPDSREWDLNEIGNKDGVVLPEVVSGPSGEASIALLHRPTTCVQIKDNKYTVVYPPCGIESQESIWISYAPLRDVEADLASLANVSAHRPLMEPRFAWEEIKIGAGAPPIVLPFGLFFVYHAVSSRHHARLRYSAGIAILDRKDPTNVLYRSPQPVLVPLETYEQTGRVADVVFPTALRARDANFADMFYGAADDVIAAARLRLPPELPVQ